MTDAQLRQCECVCLGAGYVIHICMQVCTRNDERVLTSTADALSEFLCSVSEATPLYFILNIAFVRLVERLSAQAVKYEHEHEQSAIEGEEEEEQEEEANKCNTNVTAECVCK